MSSFLKEIFFISSKVRGRVNVSRGLMLILFIFLLMLFMLFLISVAVTFFKLLSWNRKTVGRDTVGGAADDTGGGGATDDTGGAADIGGRGVHPGG